MLNAIQLKQQAMINAIDAPTIAKPRLNATDEVSFANIMMSAIGAVNDQQVAASKQAEAIELGHSDDLVTAMVLNQKASLSFTALVEVRNQMVAAVDELMKMPV